LPNGKINRHALPIPEKLRPTLTTTYQAPQSEVEQQIAKVWQEILNLEKVGINDNFFDLGGHSLQIVQVKSKLREVFNRDVLITDLFKYTNINSLAKYFSEKESSKSSFDSVHNRVNKQKAFIHRKKEFHK
jgi:acyl carrier protein